MLSPIRRDEHRHELVHHVAHLDLDRVQHLAAAEREQLAGERARLVGGPPDLAGALPHTLVVGALEQEVGVAGDDEGEVVEVVRDAAGELTDGLHLLRLEELLLEGAAIRDVDGHHDLRPAPAERRRVRADLDLEDGAVALLVVPRPRAREALRDVPDSGRQASPRPRAAGSRRSSSTPAPGATTRTGAPSPRSRPGTAASRGRRPRPGSGARRTASGTPPRTG